MGAAEQGAGKTDRWMASPRTLSFVFHEDAVLMMKRGPHRRIFPNKYNGLGGHVERDEDVYSSAVREVIEESGITPRDVRLRGVHHIDAGAESGIIMFVFTATADSREVTVHSDEGTLEWVDVARISEYDVVEDVLPVLARLRDMPDDVPPYFVHVSYDAADQIVIRDAGQ